MNLHLRIPRELYIAARADLARPHPFAAERVGFFSLATGRLAEERWLLLINEYSAVQDDHYLKDPWAGARIGSPAIRASLQRTLDSGCGQLHVHLHDHRGQPWPSEMDAQEMPALVRSLMAANPTGAHGVLILSQNGAWAEIAVPGASVPDPVDRITVVGFPLQILHR